MGLPGWQAEAELASAPPKAKVAVRLSSKRALVRE